MYSKSIEVANPHVRSELPGMKVVEGQPGYLGTLDAAATSTLLSTAADVALVLDADGVILDVHFGSPELATEGFTRWIDQPWVETVTPDSRAKVEALLRDATKVGVHKWRHVNQTSLRGADIPILYSAARVGSLGRIIAFGRDLRDVAALQQRLVDAQQSLERDYWRLRNVETRYRLLFQMSSEAILIVDAGSERVIEANPSAGELLGDDSKRLAGRALAECLDADPQAVAAMIAQVRTGGRTDDVVLRVGPERREALVSAFFFRQGSEALYLLRIAQPRTDGGSATQSKLVQRAIEHALDAFAVTDFEGRVLAVNRAFIDLAQVPSEARVRGETLDHWLGRSRVDFSVLMANLRQHGSIRLFQTTLVGEHGAMADVEVSALAIAHAEPPSLVFNIRNIGRRVAADNSGSGTELPLSVEQLTELVGRVPLKDLVREATDLVEKLCIEAALQLTQNNRASAAEVLGLSRQSLYVKLRRYGLSDAPGDGEDATDAQ